MDKIRYRFEQERLLANPPKFSRRRTIYEERAREIAGLGLSMEDFSSGPDKTYLSGEKSKS